MTPSRDELRAQLEGLEPPSPRPEFVERLGSRLQAMDQLTERRHVPVFRRPPAFGFLALAAVAVVVGILFTSLPDNGRDPRLDVFGPPSAHQPDQPEPDAVAPAAPTTTTTAPVAPTGTTTPAARAGGPTPTVDPNATGTDRLPAVPELPAGPATTQKPTATTRPRSEPTTTTTAPPQLEALTLSCVAGQPEGSPGIQCDWSQSSAPSFYAYRLWRATGSEPKQQVTAIPSRAITRFIDRPGTGVWHYQVEVVDTSGQVVGKSPIVEATCC
jgi:hypothetical protein